MLTERLIPVILDIALIKFTNKSTSPSGFAAHLLLSGEAIRKKIDFVVFFKSSFLSPEYVV